MISESFNANGAAVNSMSGWSAIRRSHTTLPVSRFVAMTRLSSPVTETTRPPQSATPRLRSGFCVPGSIFQTICPALPA